MSFAGHVYDMIRRDKQNREILKSLRNRSKNARNIHFNAESSAFSSNLTAEEMDEIKQATRERELKEQHYIFQMTYRLIGISAIVLLLIGIIFYFFVL